MGLGLPPEEKGQETHGHTDTQTHRHTHTCTHTQQSRGGIWELTSLECPMVMMKSK